MRRYGVTALVLGLVVIHVHHDVVVRVFVVIHVQHDVIVVVLYLVFG